MWRADLFYFHIILLQFFNTLWHIIYHSPICQIFKIKKGKLPTSHRYDRRTLAAFPPWGIGQELVVWDLPGANIEIIFHLSNFFCHLSA